MLAHYWSTFGTTYIIFTFIEEASLFLLFGFAWFFLFDDVMMCVISMQQPNGGLVLRCGRGMAFGLWAEAKWDD